MGMSSGYISPEDIDVEKSVEVIHRSLDLGANFLDTSDVYGAGHNEILVGKAISGRRDQVTLATKVGLVTDTLPSNTTRSRDGSPEYIRTAIEASLKRLGTDVIDLYYLHRVDPEVMLEETWAAMAELVSAGKVRALGLSEVTIDEANRAHAIHPVAAVQSEFSLWTRDPQGAADLEGRNADGAPVGDIIGWTRDHDAAFVPFSPLGRGFLTGALDVKTLAQSDFRAGLPRFSGAAGDANQGIVETVRSVATRQGVLPGQIALAWVLAQGEHIIPIPGTTKIANLESNLAAAEIVLTAADLAELNALPAAVGTRY